MELKSVLKGVNCPKSLVLVLGFKLVSYKGMRSKKQSKQMNGDTKTHLPGFNHAL
jgi:hypothetical protein